jgi:hypothetical protein
MQLEQIHELQDRLDEERENLRLLQQTLEHERATRTHGGGARERARDVNRCIIDDRAVEPPVFGRASQNVVAAAMLLCNMPEPSNSEAMLSTDVEYGSLRLKAYNEKNNDATREDALDQLEEAHDVAMLHSARYQQSLRRYHNKHVHRRDLNVGDLVLWQSQNNKGRHKLTPPWEGPYIIAEVLKPGTYKLSNKKGKTFTNAWNIEQLRRFFS